MGSAILSFAIGCLFGHIAALWLGVETPEQVLDRWSFQLAALFAFYFVYWLGH